MAIDTLAKLKSRLAYIVNRDDLGTAPTWTTTLIDDAITAAVDNSTVTISRDLAKRGGTGLQETVDNTKVTVAGTETVTLPTGAAGIKFFSIQTDPVVILRPKDYGTLINDNPSQGVNKPDSYAVVANTTAYLRPIPDAAYSLRIIYFKNLVDLTASVTNPIFDAHPDVYEAAGMVELSLLLEDQEAATRWRVVYEQKMNDMTSQDRVSGWAAAMSGASPSVQVVIA